MSVRDKMTAAFASAEGGLFTQVEKADVGSKYIELQKQGITFMGWADPFMPDRSMPEFVADAYIEALRNSGAEHYTAPIGNRDLKVMLAEKLKKHNSLDIDPDRNILITPGSDSGLFFAIIPFIGKDDEVIIPCPSYPNNFLVVEMLGGVPVSVELKEENGYQLDVPAIREKVTDRTKMVLLTHPNNPTTAVYNRHSLEELRELVIEKDLILVVDQAFEDFTFGNEMITPASMEGMFERTVTVFSFSKGMGLSGLRVGYIVADDVIMDSMFANAVAVIGATSTAAQHAVMAALKDPSFMKDFEKAYEYRRHKAYEILNSIPGVSCLLPQSGFLCWLDVSGIGDSTEIAAYLLRNAGVSVNDGKNYGKGGEGHLRIVLGVYADDDRVVAALERIAEALKRYPAKKTGCL